MSVRKALSNDATHRLDATLHRCSFLASVNQIGGPYEQPLLKLGDTATVYVETTEQARRLLKAATDILVGLDDKERNAPPTGDELVAALDDAITKART